jgi:hypothetical protein
MEEGDQRNYMAPAFSTLTPESFHDGVFKNAKDAVAVMFHDATADPNWMLFFEEVAELLRDDVEVSVAFVDCTQHESWCEQRHDFTLPALVLYQRGEFEEDGGYGWEWSLYSDAAEVVVEPDGGLGSSVLNPAEFMAYVNDALDRTRVAAGPALREFVAQFADVMFKRLMPVLGDREATAALEEEGGAIVAGVEAAFGPEGEFVGQEDEEVVALYVSVMRDVLKRGAFSLARDINTINREWVGYKMPKHDRAKLDVLEDFAEYLFQRD